MTQNYIITIDGPAASGKSTIAKKVANILDINYIDSGAMFRAVTLYMLDKGVDPKDKDRVVSNLRNIELDIVDNHLILNGVNVEKSIRENRINQNVSNIAEIKEVRELLLNFQREIARNINVIMDGRDIGSKVFPDANYKFFLTATPEIRADRRYKELIQRGEDSVTYEQILREVRTRDYIDSNREHSPLIKAQDALEIDTTTLSIDEVVNNIVKIIKGD